MARFLVSLLVLLSAMSLVISLTIPTRTSPTRICEIKRAAGRVPVVYDEVENPIETASDTAHPEMDLHTLESPQAEIQLAVDRAVEMARRTYEILGTIGIEQTPEFLAFFGVHHDQQALTILRTLFHRVADLDVGGTQIHFILRVNTINSWIVQSWLTWCQNQPPHDDDNTAHTFAHTDEEINRITIWERTWRELGPHRNVVPQLEADVVDIDEQVDAMQVSSQEVDELTCVVR
jgi:hypothetical protein